MKNAFADVIEKKKATLPPLGRELYLLRTLSCVTFSMTLAACIIQFYRLLNYNVDNLMEWRLRVTRI